MHHLYLVFLMYFKFKWFFRRIADEASDIIHAVAKSKVDNENREIFVFREGSIVAWNISDSEMENILEIIRNFEIKPYDRAIVKEEIEIMPYTFSVNR